MRICKYFIFNFFFKFIVFIFGFFEFGFGNWFMYVEVG